MMDWLKSSQIYGNTFFEWIFAGILFVVVFLGFYIVKSVSKRRLGKWSHLVDSDFRDLLFNIVKSTSHFIIFIVALYLALLTLSFPAKAERFIQSFLTISILIQFIFWGNQLIDFGLRRFLRRRETAHGGHDPAITTILPTAKFLSRLALFLLVFLLALDNLGVNITALLAGLGVGGIAVALALQNILGDLFASLSIVLDKPFEVGDGIQVGERAGIVERIGLKTTRIRSVTGEQLIFSNANLLSSQIQNFRRMNERRQLFNIGIIYELPNETLKKIPGWLKDAVESLSPNVRFDRSHLKSFGDFAINFEVSYYVLSSEMKAAMDAQQEINFKILDIFERENISFAYPTQTVRPFQDFRPSTRKD